MTSNLKTLLATLGIDSDRAIILPGGGYFLEHSFDIAPEDFLEQAEEDYKHGGNAALLNSITNAKRAIRSEIEAALYYFGFDPQRMRIQQMVELLREIGIVVPRILRRVDDTRNLLEHEYKMPTIQEVEDALDLASLFVEAMHRSILCADFGMGNEDEFIEHTLYDFSNEIIFNFDSENEQFVLYGYKTTPSPDSPLGVNQSHVYLGDEAVIISSDPMYIPILRMAVVVEKERKNKTRKAVAEFFEALRLNP